MTLEYPIKKLPLSTEREEFISVKLK
jgi:hypothetical protein